MKTIPSLIASSTIGIAAAGLALGKQESSTIHKITSSIDELNQNQNHDRLSSLSSRPGTSFTNFDSVIDFDCSSVIPPKVRTTSFSKHHRRPPLTHVNKSKYTYHRRPPSSLNIDRTLSHEIFSDDDRIRESISSRSSWIRRLSSRPTSHSQRECTVPDSPQAAPPNTWQNSTPRRLKRSPVSLPRNRLVKRIPKERVINGSDAFSKSGKLSLTIRRPITSHQRIFLSQRQPKIFDEKIKDSRLLSTQKNSDFESYLGWRQYFDSRPIRISKERSSGNLNEEKHKKSTTCNRIVLDEMKIPTLVKPEMIISLKDHRPLNENYQAHETDLTCDEGDDGIVNPNTSASRISSRVENSTKFPQRSLSTHFTSPIARLSRPGSFGGLRFKAEGKTLSRCASVLTPGTRGRSSVSAYGFTGKKNPAFDQNSYQPVLMDTVKGRSSNDLSTESINLRNRKNSSPLPSLSRISTLSIDLARIGLSSSSSSSSSFVPLDKSKITAITTSRSCSHTNNNTNNNNNFTQISLSSAVQSYLYEAPRFSLTNSRNNYMTFDIADRASTLIGSDLDTKGFTSYDEDDTDFQSETVFDSMRSGTMGTMQSPKLPIEFIFDDSPIFMNEKLRLNKNSFCESLENSGLQKQGFVMLGNECMAMPLKDNSLILKDHPNYSLDTNDTTAYSEKVLSPMSIICLPKTSEGRSCQSNAGNDYDNDMNEDWTKDGELFELEKEPEYGFNTFCVKKDSRRNTLPLGESNNETQRSNDLERPKTNLFDWSEPSSSEKLDVNGNSPRPKTAHVKQLLDVRCGRVLGRRAPTALHIRSQSVPVVPDTDASKVTSKFGTWGLGSKAIREDWDGDFEFDNADSVNLNGGEFSKEQGGVQVPEAIKANQENIVGHVGQIREVCLLVEDLKRLRALGKAQGLLNGEFEPLWIEAEGIIALAAPVEEEEEEEKELQRLRSLNTNNNSSLITPNMLNGILHTQSRSDTLFCDGAQQVSDKKSKVVLFSPDDENSQRIPSISPPCSPVKSSIEVARKVMESIHQQRPTTDPVLQKFVEGSGAKMPFDTTSLKDLVSRAAAVSRALGQVIRAADGFDNESRPRNSSPAFTRMFTDPMIVPPRNSPCELSKSSSLNDSIDDSPLQQRMYMMTVT